MRQRFRPLLLLTGSLLAITACSSTDGRELPEPGPDQTASIAVTDTVPPEDGISEVESALGTGADGSAVVSDTAVVEDDGFTLGVFAPWDEAGVIPLDYTCDAGDESPDISWVGVPVGTVELAVVFTDLDAENFVHWVAFGIPPTAAGLAGGADLDAAITQATNSFGNVGYGGPCPPGEQHAYLLELYALSQQLELPDGVPAAEAIQAIQSSSLAVVSVLGLYPGQ